MTNLKVSDVLNAQRIAEDKIKKGVEEFREFVGNSVEITKVWFHKIAIGYGLGDEIHLGIQLSFPAPNSVTLSEDPSVNEILQRKIKLESLIEKSVIDFEDETGVKVDGLRLIVYPYPLIFFNLSFPNRPISKGGGGKLRWLKSPFGKNV